MKKIYLFLLFCFPIIAMAQSLKKDVKAHRKSYKADFLKEERSPFYNKEQELKYIRFYRPKKKYKVTGNVTLTPDAKPFEMATYSGAVRPYRKYAVIEFKLNGQQHQLAIYQNLGLLNVPGYKDYLFLPFKDATNAQSTYGGGRYINLKIGDIKNGKITLDFNKNYNPYCAFSGGYSCPIPPKENHLDIKIKAGEKNFAKKH